MDFKNLSYIIEDIKQGLSQYLETGCQKLAIVKYLGVLFFEGETTKYSDYNHTDTLVSMYLLK